MGPEPSNSAVQYRIPCGRAVLGAGRVQRAVGGVLGELLLDQQHVLPGGRQEPARGGRAALQEHDRLLSVRCAPHPHLRCTLL